MKIKKGDNVIILSGKDKGKRGKVVTALPREDRVVVEGINLKKKHQKPRRSNQKGQMIEKSMPIHISNVAIVDPEKTKASRIGYKMEGGKKIRIARKSGAAI